MKKFILIILLLTMQMASFAQINVINKANGSMTITPNGVRGNNPSSTAEDSLNIAIGENALQNNVGARRNIAIGKNTLKTLSLSTSGRNTNNIAIGYESQIFTNPSAFFNGDNNTSIGVSSLRNNTIGTQNVAIGSAALNANTEGGFNVAIGTNAMKTNMVYNGNTAVGNGAMANANDNLSIPGNFTYNTAIGNLALRGSSTASANTGVSNTTIGANSMINNTSGFRNTAVGYISLSNNTTGDYNTTIGNQSGQNIITGNGNIMVGSFSGGTLDVNGKLFIANSNTDSPLIKGDFQTSELKINNKLRIGGTTDTPATTLHVDGDISLSKVTLISGNLSHTNFNRNRASIIAVDLPANGGAVETLNSINSGVEGAIIYVYPVTGTSILIKHEDAGSVAANRIITNTGATVTFTNTGGCTLIYDGTAQRWRMLR